MPAAPTRLNVLLPAVAAELTDLSHLVLRLESVLAHAHPPDHRMQVELQVLDLLAQRLTGTAEFLGTVAETLPDGCTADIAAAAGAVRLAHLAARLRGTAPGAPLQHAPGEAELF